jgi:fused signal recognition particle receptor
MGKLSNWLKRLFTSEAKENYQSYVQSLEAILIEADFSPQLAKSAVKAVQTQFDKMKNPDIETVMTWFKQYLKDLYLKATQSKTTAVSNGPEVILVVGVNGAGKTTSCAKLASYYRTQERRPLLVAADTFRAGAVKQLQLWGERIHVDVVANESSKDPSSVVYDGVERASKGMYDVVICDTAGRLQTKDHLMQELAKLRRVIQKKIPTGPHQTLLVVDASQGQNAIVQAQVFHQSTPLTGLVLTKLDGVSKGGIIWSIAQHLKVGVDWIGVGEKVTDWQRFDIDAHIQRIVEEDDE